MNEKNNMWEERKIYFGRTVCCIAWVVIYGNLAELCGNNI